MKNQSQWLQKLWTTLNKMMGHKWIPSVTPQPGKRVDTWQPPRALDWNPVSQAPFKDSQGQKMFTHSEFKIPTERKYKTILNYYRNFDSTPSIIRKSPCPKKTIIPHSHQWETNSLTFLDSKHIPPTKQLRRRKE